jgi:uncharacterized protein YggT (Ycf19 family)
MRAGIISLEIRGDYMFGGKLITVLVTFFFGVIEVLLAFRIILRLLGANLSANFTTWILNNTDPLVAPFEGIFPSPSLATTFVLDTAAIFALIVYAVVAFLLSELVEALDGVSLRPKKKEKE